MELLKTKNKMNEEEMELPQVGRYSDAYIRLAKNRVIFLNEDITKETSASISALLLYFDHMDEEKDINLLINSNGGDASALSAIYDAMQMIKAPVKTICMGKCYSAAAILLATGSPGKRLALKNSQIMIHGLQCAFPVMGENDDVKSKIYLDFLKKSNTSIMQIMAKHIGKPVEEIEKDCLRDFYLTANQAFQYGIIDKIII